MSSRFVHAVRRTILLWILTAGSAAGATLTERSGDAFQILLPAAAYGATWYLDDVEGRNQFYRSFATNLVVTYGLKYSVAKERPDGGAHSFPSGHTSAAFQGATFIHRRYGLGYAWPAYLAAAFTGYSRVFSEHHYVEDVVAGALIGGWSSWYFTSPNFQLAPRLVADSVGLSLYLKW